MTRHLFVLSALVWLGLASEITLWAQFDDFEVSLTPASRTYCHVLRFPQGWSTQHFDDRAPQRLLFGTERSDYEFRVSGVLGTKFLAGAFTENVGTNYYANNWYEVTLWDATAPANEVDRKAWDAGTVLPIVRKSAFPPIGTVPNQKRLEFHGFQFNRTGDIWAQPSGDASRISPDQAWLVLQSTSPGKKAGSAHVFLDFFNADNGQKLFTIAGIFSSVRGGQPEDAVLSKTGWVTERYFIVPLGKKLDRCLVCDFDARNRGKENKQ